MIFCFGSQFSMVTVPVLAFGVCNAHESVSNDTKRKN